MNSFIDRYLSGHVTFGPVTIHGFNAMHGSISLRTRRWGIILFHPTTWIDGHKWPWYFICSPNGTPWASTFSMGPGLSWMAPVAAHARRVMWGHNFDVTEQRMDVNYVITNLIEQGSFLEELIDDPDGGKQGRA